MSAVVGIDLGTTNTVVACMRNGRVEVLADDKGNRLLPSVVSFHPNGEVLVGQAAKARRLVDSKNTIASIKRLMGRPWSSDEIRLARSRFAFELREGPGQGSLVVARGEAYTIPEISAFVLKRARQIAEAALGDTVDRAVVTVPAHFNELQRASTKVAGRVAGLEVMRILNEPTAAALAYGLGSKANERIAVFDFGGGTFDCSLLELSGNLYEVLATAGDTFLGGDDIDTVVAERMSTAFLTEHRYDPRADAQAFEKLRAAAETLKIDLSTNPQSQVELADIAYGVGGSPLGLRFGMSQADLDVLVDPFVDRTLAVTQDALKIARLSSTAFDRVILVGGSTRIPLVRRRVEAFFGIAPLDRVNPDEVVAVGAALQAAALVQAGRRSIPPPPTPNVSTQTASPMSGLGDDDDIPTAQFRLRSMASNLLAAASPSAPDTSPSLADDTAPHEVPSEETLPSIPSVRTLASAVPSSPSIVTAVVPPPIPSRKGAGPTPPLAPVVRGSAIKAPAVNALAVNAPTTKVTPAPAQRAVPVLIDVTPRALVVEVVGGFSDTVIARNARIPCEYTRVFATGRDQQTVVHVRVAQGEAERFGENMYLGELELSGLRPAPRGEVTLSVTFELDANGTMQVRAVDGSTGREARAAMKLITVVQSETDIAAMITRTGAATVTGG